MCELILGLNQVQIRVHSGVLRKLGSVHREQTLNGVLHALVDLAFVQNAAEALEHTIQALSNHPNKR